MAAVAEPIFVTPQVYQIFRYHTAAGVSILSWVGSAVLTLVWLWYGVVHRDRMIILYQSLWTVGNILVIIGALIYGGRWY